MLRHSHGGGSVVTPNSLSNRSQGFGGLAGVIGLEVGRRRWGLDIRVEWGYLLLVSCGL